MVNCKTARPPRPQALGRHENISCALEWRSIDNDFFMVLTVSEMMKLYIAF